MQDNKGRTLSKEQQEYFKDSKLRDENGSLLEVYHGTPYEFYKFNYDKFGKKTSSLGPGFYFTDKIEYVGVRLNKINKIVLKHHYFLDSTPFDIQST